LSHKGNSLLLVESLKDLIMGSNPKSKEVSARLVEMAAKAIQE